MEELIRQAFLHVDVLGQHVADGHYDLIGPNGDIILPQVWETVVEPDWVVTMHMWPIPEKPKEPDPEPPLPEDPGVVIMNAKKPGEVLPAAGAPISDPIPPRRRRRRPPASSQPPSAPASQTLPADSPDAGGPVAEEAPPPPPPPPAPPGSVVDNDAESPGTVDGAIVIPPAGGPGAKKPRPAPTNLPGSWAMWMAGSRTKQQKSLKAEKKPEVVQPQGNECSVM